MITSVELENFKGIKHQRFDLGKLNVFVGENGTGKSTVIHALSIIKRSLNSSSLNTDLPYLNLGQIKEIVRAAQNGRITVSGTRQMNLQPIVSNNVNFRCQISFDLLGISEYNVGIKIGEHEHVQKEGYSIENTWNRNGIYETRPTSWNVNNVMFNFSPTNSIGSAFDIQGYGYQNTLQKVNRPSDEVRVFASNMIQTLRQLSSVVRIALENYVVVPALRGFTEPEATQMKDKTTELSPRGGIMEMGDSVASNLLFMEDDESQKIREWERTLFEVNPVWRPSPGNKISLRNSLKNTTIANEGFGSNQAVFIFEEIARVDKDSLIVVEEPELGLHPSAQFKLGKLIGKITKQEEKNFILVTHSEHIVSGILNSIRLGEINPDDVRIWLFEKRDSSLEATLAKVTNEGTTDVGLNTFIKASVEQLQEFGESKGNKQ